MKFLKKVFNKLAGVTTPEPNLIYILHQTGKDEDCGCNYCPFLWFDCCPDFLFGSTIRCHDQGNFVPKELVGVYDSQAYLRLIGRINRMARNYHCTLFSPCLMGVACECCCHDCRKSSLIRIFKEENKRLHTQGLFWSVWYFGTESSSRRHDQGKFGFLTMNPEQRAIYEARHPNGARLIERGRLISAGVNRDEAIKRTLPVLGPPKQAQMSLQPLVLVSGPGPGPAQEQMLYDANYASAAFYPSPQPQIPQYPSPQVQPMHMTAAVQPYGYQPSPSPIQSPSLPPPPSYQLVNPNSAFNPPNSQAQFAYHDPPQSIPLQQYIPVQVQPRQFTPHQTDGI